MADFAMIAGVDQWLRVAHDNTTLDQSQQVVQLAWLHESELVLPTEPVSPAGLAFDPWCRIYHAIPENSVVERLLWSDRTEPKLAKNLFEVPATELGDFQSEQQLTEISQPRAMVIDKDAKLFIADTGNRQVLIIDLIGGQLIRTLSFSGIPLALATSTEWVFLVLQLDNNAFQLLRFNAHSLPEPIDVMPLPDGTRVLPGAIAVDQNDRIVVLHQANTEDAAVWAIDGKNDIIEVPYASAMVFSEDSVLTVARTPGADFLRFRITIGNYSALPHLQARLYDGRGIAIDPDGRVAYWSKNGLMSATLARIKYANQGRLVCFRLDNQQIQRRWGRVFIDACLPQGTQIKLGFIVADEQSSAPPVVLTSPLNVGEFDTVRPDLSPPLPSAAEVEKLKPAQLLHRRSQNRELPWSFTEEPWRTFEAPVIAPPGRYLWLVIDLFGKSHTSPKIKNIRVEFPAQDLLRRLPNVFSEQQTTADFLSRYLSLMHGNIQELDQRASQRQVLVDPMAAPLAVLPWLSSLVGMELDQRWSEASQREILREAIWLFRFRGTVAGLKKFIQIYLRREISIIEHYQVRGLGGSFVGESDSLQANSILGAGFRIGGKLGEDKSQLLSTETFEPVDAIDAISTHAHKFSVIIPLILSQEQQSVVAHILEIHRPAHTLFDICSVDAGMRLGTGLHIGLTSVVGKSSGFGQLRVSHSVLGRSDVLGVAKPGTSVGNSRLGSDSRVG